VSLLKVRLREAWNWGGLSARELIVRAWTAIDKHDTLNQAAVVAFYAMMALVPLLGLILAVGVGAHARVAAEILDLSARFLPTEADAVVRDQVTKIQTGTPVGLVSLSAVILLWSASSLFVAVMDTTNAAYGVRDGRPWWKKRLVAIALTLAEVALLVVASVLAVIWPALVDRIGVGGFSWLASGGATVVQWLAVVVALLAAFALAYYFGPHVKQEWEWITPGGVLGVLVLVAASLGLRVYLRFGTSYSETYGALAGVVLMQLWLYLAATALLVGAEVNCVIEHAAPHGRASGERAVPQ
jgi:membrane protein